ncbi:MAG: transglycosylase SLT domain-containing protein [Chthoniobacterales bacterium]|nr:transglycosylase SLT domain-containing protein [Chthoniobacterales bacterium]
MIRFLFKFIICLLLAAGVGIGLLALRSGDPFYTLFEWLSPARFQQYDQLIHVVSASNDLDPMLVKAVVWRESRFDPNKLGGAGERGLMQVSEIAAREWVEENRIENFRVEELLDPKINLEAGAWYLHRAMRHWQAAKDPTPFALAEYNAGASRAQRWAGGDGRKPISAKTFQKNIDFPGTKNYVGSILDRYRFYQKRGRM